MVSSHAYLPRWFKSRFVNLTKRIKDLGQDSQEIAHLVALVVEDLRLLGRVADLLQNGCLSRVRSSNDQDAEATDFLAQFLEVLVIEIDIGR
jgi:hypothetical protein